MVIGGSARGASVNAGMAIRAQKGCTPASFIARALRALNASVIFVFAAIGFSIPRAVCIIEASKPKQFANV